MGSNRQPRKHSRSGGFIMEKSKLLRSPLRGENERGYDRVHYSRVLRAAYSTVSRAHTRQRSTRRHRRSAVPQIPPPSVSGELRTKWRGCVAGRPAANVLYLSYRFLPIRRLKARLIHVRHELDICLNLTTPLCPLFSRPSSGVVLFAAIVAVLWTPSSLLSAREQRTRWCVAIRPRRFEKNSGQCGVGADIQNVQNRCK